MGQIMMFARGWIIAKKGGPAVQTITRKTDPSKIMTSVNVIIGSYPAAKNPMTGKMQRQKILIKCVAPEYSFLSERMKESKYGDWVRVAGRLYSYSIMNRTNNTITYRHELYIEDFEIYGNWTDNKNIENLTESIDVDQDEPDIAEDIFDINDEFMD